MHNEDLAINSLRDTMIFIMLGNLINGQCYIKSYYNYYKISNFFHIFFRELLFMIDKN